MPIYEFLCAECNRIFAFHSFKVATEKIPACPKCGETRLTRVPSRFGVAAKTGGGTGGDAGEGDVDDPRVEREMMRFAAELEKMTEIAGEPVTPAMEEMIRRLEAGEDPEKVEEEMGDAIEEEMGEEGGGGFSGAAPTRDDGLYPM